MPKRLRRGIEKFCAITEQVADPVSAGLVASLAKPGGNITGFAAFDYSIGAKWVELLKEIATAGQVELASLRGFARRSDAARLR